MATRHKSREKITAIWITVNRSIAYYIESRDGNPIRTVVNDIILSYVICFNFFFASIYLFQCEREMFYLTTHSTHFIYGYMASDIWLRTILIVRKETPCRHIGYSYRLTARVLLYAPSHRQDNTYHSLC